MPRPPPRSTLFPYTTLFRSGPGLVAQISSKTADRSAISRVSTSSRNSRSEEHTSELQSHSDLVCRLLLEKKKKASTENDSIKSSCWSYKTSQTTQNTSSSHS